MISLAEAARRIGSRVIYTSHFSTKSEEGVITGVNWKYIFVKYSGCIGSKATRPEDLKWEYDRLSPMEILLESEERKQHLVRREVC